MNQSPIPFLDLRKVHRSMESELTAAFEQQLESGVFSGGESMSHFKKEISAYLDLAHVIPCSNGTDALELALKVLGLGAEDEVLVPAISWVSTVEAVVNVGCKPVFVDVCDDGLINLSLIQQVINDRTKAIIPVHLYGKMVNMEALLAESNKYDLQVIEDAAQAFGSFQEGISAGGWGDIGCFSFYPTKNLGALGEAGMLCARSKSVADVLAMMVNHGQVTKDHHVRQGRNAKMDDLQAAFLRVKLRHFSTQQQARKNLAARYLDMLKSVDELQLPDGLESTMHNAHLFTVRCKERNQLRAYMADRGIGTAIHYPEMLPALLPYRQAGDFPVASQLVKETLSLPLHAGLTVAEVERVCSIIQAFYG